MNLIIPHSSTSPGNVQGKIDFLKNTRKVGICGLSPTHICIQGMDINEEGNNSIIKIGFFFSNKGVFPKILGSPSTHSIGSTHITLLSFR